MAGRDKPRDKRSTVSWQYPHVNVFKHCQISQWRRCSKEGDVSSQMDRDIKATVYKISGSIPAGNYIQFPKSTSQSLSLTGRFIYLLLRPITGKYFVIHLELVSGEGMLIRLSFSNLFKEFKSSSTWLQLPYVTDKLDSKQPHMNGGDSWTILCMDLLSTLRELLHCSYSYVKGIRLCGNLLVRNIFTSDIRYLPNVVEKFGAAKLPKEMTFHVPKDCVFTDFYNFITFPPPQHNMNTSTVAKGSKKHHVTCKPADSENIEPDTIQNQVPVVKLKDHKQHQQPPTPIITPSSPTTPSNIPPTPVAKKTARRQLVKETEKHDQFSRNTKVTRNFPWPDPIMSLEKVVGFGGGVVDHVIFTRDCREVVFPSHSLIVAMEIGATRRQKIFIGHTNKVSCLAFNNDNSLLASGQSGRCGVVRVWNYVTRQCMSLVTLPSSSVALMSFSHSGNVLCTVGREGGKNRITLWNTSPSRNTSSSVDGEVQQLATTHTDADINRMRMAQFDDTRMVSCGWDNIRLWRLRSKSLKFCPVNLEEHHQMHFTDISFEVGYHDNGDITDRFIYASTRSGHLFEVHYRRIYVSRVWQLLPYNPTATPINSMVIHEAFCVTGSDDGLLRVWPLDFSNVILEVEHEGPVTAVDISADGMKILAGTKSGTIGVLYASTKEYSTVLRSHVAMITCVDMTTQHLISCSNDGTIRIWDVGTMNQLYDFRAEGETPCCVRCHPKQASFACGFDSGCVQLFDMTSSLMEYRHHRMAVSGIVFTSLSTKMFSCSCDSTLAVYDITSLKMIKLIGNTVVTRMGASPGLITLDHNDTKLAVVGPLPHTITILDADNLNELVRLDITAMPSPHSATPTVDIIVAICFGPQMIQHLVVTTATGSVLKFDTTSGRLLFEHPQVHGSQCTAMAISGCGRYLVTGGNKTLKVWPYSLQPGSRCQVFIGHCDVVTQVMFTANNSHLITVGEGLYCWSLQPLPIFPTEPLDLQTNPSHPRHTPPKPSSYKPVISHTTSFLTPCGNMDHVISHDSEEEDDDVSSSSGDLSDDIIIDHESEHTTSPVTTHKEDTQQTAEPAQPVTPCSLPSSLKYYRWQSPEAFIAEQQYLAPKKQEGIQLRSIIGYNGRGRNNLVWQPITGTFAYTCGSIVVMEDLSTGEQNFLTGHREEISTLSLSNDGQHLASACGGRDNYKGEIKIWQMKSYRCRKTLLFHASQITCLTYSRDDRFIISLGDHQENVLAVWSTENYQLLAATVTPYGPMLDITWDPHVAYECVSCGCGPSLCFWLLEEAIKDEMKLNVHEAEIPSAITDGGKMEFTSLCYSTDYRLFVATNSGYITLWDTRTNNCTMYWRCGTSEVMCLSCDHHHGNNLSVGLSSHQLQLWKLTMPPKSDQLPVATMETTLQLDGALVAGMFDDDLLLGVVGTISGTVWYVNWQDGSTIKLLAGHGKKVSGVSSLPWNGSHFVVSCSHDGTMRVWSDTSQQEIIHLKALNKACTSLAVCPVAMGTTIGGKQVGVAAQEGGMAGQCAVGYHDGVLRVFELAQRKMMYKWRPHQASVNHLTYSNDGHVILSGDMDGLVAISNSHNGIVLRMITEHRGIPITDLSVAKKSVQQPNMDTSGLWLVASGDRRVSVWTSDWSKTSCQLIDWLTFPGPVCAPDGSVKKHQSLPPSLARFSPSDSDIIIYTGYGLRCCVQLYSLSQKQVVRMMSLNYWATSMDISPQGHLIAMGCKERLLTIMDYEEGSFQDYPMHSDTIDCVEFSDNNSELLYSVCSNGVYLWTVLSPADSV